MQPGKDWKIFLLLSAVLIPTYLYGIHYLPLRGEEANRILTAYEMVYFGDWFNLTHLGEPYYAKPPLFMWLVAAVSSLLGWAQESARLISVVSSFLTALLVYIFSLRLFGDRGVALLSAFVLLTLGDLPLFYGFLAEIDAFHMFIFTLSAVGSFLLLSKGREYLAFTFAGFLTALTFLTKGLPALYHIPLTFLVLLIYTGRWRSIFSPKTVVGLLSLLLPLSVWYLNLKNPQTYLLSLWGESFRRTPVAQDRFRVIVEHLLLYPLLNLRQTLPHSLYAIFNLKSLKNFFPAFRREFYLLIALIGLNYLPYLISPGARGRYILVIFPFIAALLGYLLKDFLLREVRFWKVLYGGLFTLYTTGWFLALKNEPFFGFYGYLPLLSVGGILILPMLLSLKFPKSWLVFTALLLGVVKFGYINYFAPWREHHHPEREIALKLSEAFPKGEKIRYLPKTINMEMCAYTDIFTKGIVLRGEGRYFLTTEGELPQGGYRILKTYKGWVAGVFTGGGN